MKEKTGIEKALDRFNGSAVKLAKAVDGFATRQNIECWSATGTVPPEKCVAIHRATGVSLGELNTRMDWNAIYRALRSERYAKSRAPKTIPRQVPA